VEGSFWEEALNLSANRLLDGDDDDDDNTKFIAKLCNCQTNKEL
jgi:hypothetical protein